MASAYINFVEAFKYKTLRGEYMAFIISIITVFIIAVLGNKFIKKHSIWIYVFSTIISITLVLGTKFNITNKISIYIVSEIWNSFFRGSVAGAIFILVMVTSIFNNKSVVKKKLMSIRTELSIIASILTLGHNFSMGQTYFVMLINGNKNMPLNYFIASICSLVMMIVMLPLFITSFKCIKNKIKMENWRKLHKSAYVFYGIMYIHVMFLIFPRALSGDKIAFLNTMIYSIIFLVYGILRIKKVLKNEFVLLRLLSPVAIAIVLISVSMTTENIYSGHINQTVNQDELNTMKIITDTIAEKNDKSNDSSNKYNAAEKTIIQKNDEEKKVVVTNNEKNIESKEEEISQIETKQDKNENLKNDNKSETQKQVDTEPKIEISKDTKKEVGADTAKEVNYRYKNGTFSGEGDGFGGKITVNITIENDTILSISVSSHSDDEPYFSEGSKIINSIISAQSPDVSTVSGATFSSNGIKKAVKEALRNAQN